MAYLCNEQKKPLKKMGKNYEEFCEKEEFMDFCHTKTHRTRSSGIGH